MQIWILLAGVNGALAVVAAAAGSHALRTAVGDQQFAWFDQAARFHLLHAVMLAVLGVMRRSGMHTALLDWCGGSFQGGIVLFCGSLYWLGLNGPGSLGSLHALTPLGGLLLIAGWGLLAVAGWRGLS